jgi:hypothetical protein
MADFSSMFGGMAQPQVGGMFGAQQQSPLMQLLGMGGQQQPGMDQNQMMQLAQRLMAMGNPSALPQGSQQMPAMPAMPGMPARPPIGMPQGMLPGIPGMTGPMPQQSGRVPGTVDNMLQGFPPPQNYGAPGAFSGISPDLVRMLMTPRQI